MSHKLDSTPRTNEPAFEAQRAAWSRPAIRCLGASYAETASTNTNDGLGDQLS